MQHADANFLAAGRLLITNKASLIGLIGVEDEPSIKFLQYASVESKMTYRVPSVHSHYLVFGKSPLISTGGPMRANFLIANDAVIFAAKRAGTITYLWGITVENLIAWVPPNKAGELICEEGILQSWKSTHSDIKELVPLKDTETHPLTALADKLMSHLPTFAAAKIKDGKGAAKWCVNTFTHNIKFVVDASEVEERKRAKEKSTTAKDKEGVESAAGGVAAKAVWTERKSCMLAMSPYYRDSMAERFIVIELNEATGQPAEATVVKLRDDLK